MHADAPTVVVADDDRGCRSTVQEALETVGFRTVPAGTGQEAIDVIQRSVVHLGVFDVHMPEMNGLDAIRFLRQEEIWVPVIVMTSDLSTETHERALHVGAVALVAKPVDLTLIRDAARRALGQMN